MTPDSNPNPIDYGVLSDLMADPDVTAIQVNRFDHIFLWNHWQGRVQSPVMLPDEAAARHLADQIASTAGITLDYQNPIAEVLLPDGAHALIIIPPIASQGTLVQISKVVPHDMTFEKLVHLKAMSQGAADFLLAAIKAGANIAVIGGHRSGKTTLLNVLAEQINPAMRIVVIEELNDLSMPQANVVKLSKRRADINGRGEVSNNHLIQTAWTLTPEALVVSLVEANDVAALLNAMYMGMLTHFAMQAISPRDALQWLEVNALSNNIGQSIVAIREQIAKALDLIVHIELMDNGLRGMMSIHEVRHVQGENIVIEPIFKRTDGVPGRMIATGSVPHFLKRIYQHNIELDEAIFAANET